MVSEQQFTEREQERTRIVRRAQDLFFTHGFTRVTTEEVSRELGISKKTLYLYFDSKEELLEAAVRLMREEIRAELDQILADRKAEPVEKLQRLLNMVGLRLARFRQPFMAELQRKAPKIWQELESFRQENVLTAVEKLFVQGGRKGMLRRDVNPAIFIQMFLAVIRTVLTPESISTLSISASEAFATVVTVLLGGVLTDEARERITGPVQE